MHGGDKESFTGEGSCVFLKGRLLFKEGGKKPDRNCLGKHFAQGKEKIHGITAEINYTEKPERKRDGESSRERSRVCRRKMHPLRVEWQRSAFKFKTHGFWEKGRLGWSGVFYHHLMKYLFKREEKKNANTGNLPVPWLRKPSESLTHWTKPSLGR